MRSTVAAKALMAVTGLSLMGFLVIHVLGNLPLLASPQAGQTSFNHYAEWLSERVVIKLASVGTMLFFLAHAAQGLRLTRKARRSAGPRPAGSPSPHLGRWNARWLPASGVLLVAFLVLHLADFWYPFKFSAELLRDAEGRRDLYGLVAHSLQVPWRAVAYLAGTLALGLHLNHGVRSAGNSLGVVSRPLARALGLLGQLLSWAISGGFAAMILAQWWRGAFQ